jgi:hypothetical protein
VGEADLAGEDDAGGIGDVGFAVLCGVDFDAKGF